MTADLDLSPEAVERFARRAFTVPGRLHAIQIAVEDCGAACKQVFLAQGDYPTVRDVADGVRNELDHAAMLARALSAENAHLRAERAAAWQAGAEAMQLLWNAAAGATTAICHALDDGTVEDHSHQAMLDTVLNDLNAALAATRALPLPGQPTNNEENT